MAFFKKKAKTDKKAEPEITKDNQDSSAEETAEVSPFAIQWEILSNLYQQVPGNKWNEEIARQLKETLQRLQSTKISGSLLDSFTEESLQKYKNKTAEEFASISKINRSRMESLAELSHKNMRSAVQESLYLFDVNYDEVPELQLDEVVGYDDSGRPIYEIFTFPVFPKDTPAGVADRDGFLPLNLKDGRNGMSSFITQTYPELFELKSEKEAGNEPIKAISTIGSLGGIGHKPNSDMDAQVMVDTEVHYEHTWNDADFLIALIHLIFRDVRKHFAKKILTKKELQQLEEQAGSILRTRYAEGTTAEELVVIHAVYPGTYAQERDNLLWKKIKRFNEEQTLSIFWKIISMILHELPDFSQYLKPILLFFPFLEKINEHEIQTKCFPLAGILNNRARLLMNLVQFYQHSILGPGATSTFLKKIKEQHGEDAVKETKKQQGYFLEHLKKSGNFPRTIQSFLNHLVKHIGHTERLHLPDALQILRDEFESDHPKLQETAAAAWIQTANQNFRMNWSRLIEVRKDQEAQANEAECEYPLKNKIKAVEAYLTRKYPDTEVHYFLNVIRRMRKGQHTPFLVSPEGSLAYSLMLNDFLLNTATILGGLTPMPFELPPDVRVLASIGVFPDDEWSFSETNSKGEEVQVPIRKMPDWGHIDIPRDLFNKHVIPIFLRESEKVSHRNLPKALLNCWWVEMLFLMDDPKAPLTSITRLLWNPNQRYFIQNGINSNYARIIKQMEQEFPHLEQDPWWLKFSEMLTRFTDTTIQDQIIFCFAQHIRLSDVIDFDGDGQTIFVDKKANWRTHSLVRFHQKFYNTPQKQLILKSFAQGHDDVANKIEFLLKKLFLESMNRVEKKLCVLAQRTALNSVNNHLRRIVGSKLDLKENSKFLTPLLQEALQRVSIEDPRILVKMRKKIALNELDKLQARNIYLDHQRLKNITAKILSRFEAYKLNPSTLESLIMQSRVPVAGDVLENVIFKYHFERNFKRKPFQVPLPISKTLSLPRSLIVLSFDPKHKNWKFCSMLSSTGKISARSDSLEMFNAPVVQGIARCVFSGYVGYDSRNLTAFQKEASKIRSKLSNNPLTPQELQRLSVDIQNFFKPIKLLPRELLEQKHYIKDIYAVCNANQFLVVSLIVRDNLGECFVVDIDLSAIKLKSNMPIGEEHQPLGVFLDRLRSKKSREMFKDALGKLKIPIDPQQPPNFGTWVNTLNFDIQVAQKYHSIYITGIVDLIWPSEGDYVPWRPNSVPMKEPWEKVGKKCIDQYHKEMEEKQRQRDQELRKVQRDSREYVSRMAAERAAKEKQLLE